MIKDVRIRFTLRLTKELSEKLRLEARKTGHSTNSLILYALESWVKEKGLK